LVLERINLIRNIGQFDSVSDGAALPFSKLTVIYAENGRGKTTLSAILRSLGNGDPAPITERKRLSAAQPPHVVVKPVTGAAMSFQGSGWSQTFSNLSVFDDVFVDQNVYSGLSVETAHRQSLHEFILGAQGVSLGKAFQDLVDRNEEHNKAIRAKADAIPATVRGTMDADFFCSLPAHPAIEDEIRAAERLLAAARDQDAIRNAPTFEILDLPSFDLIALEGLLSRDLAALDMHAAQQIQDHLARIGQGAEAWVANGVQRMQASSSSACPFCAQDLRSSPLVDHYRAYFSASYDDLKQAIIRALGDIHIRHGANVATAFERGIRVWGERRQFWSRFCDLPDVALDTAAGARAWNAARAAVQELLAVKQSAPLDRIAVNDMTREAVVAYDVWRTRVETLSRSLQTTNAALLVVKEQAAAGNPAAIAADIARLKAIRARHMPEIAALCDNYRREKMEKGQTEAKRDAARAVLDTYRKTIFPSYETAINEYLRKFGAGFRLAKVTSSTSRAGSACTYSVAIGTNTIAVAGTPALGTPSFRSTLSAGDRNTLALAFFFTSLDRDPALKHKIVVIDDPITSLDEHRHLTTVQEVGRLAQRVGQLIVLSHSKPFLCQLWEGVDKSVAREAIEIGRSGSGSSLRGWSVHHDLITPHDKRHALLRSYIDSSVPDNRPVAEALRYVLERFVRVAYPDHFAPGDMLGKFVNLCRQRIGTTNQILDAFRTQELDDILSYANRFHHDTNPAYQTEVVSDGELVGFVERTIRFTRH
jgi:wobble nucleotide-excising tRNase